MTILIADDSEIYRLALKLYIHKHWSEALIYEVSTMFEVVAGVFDVEFDLLILDINMPGSELLEDFVSKACNYTKVIIFSDMDRDDPRVENLIKIGADAFLPKLSKQSEVVSALQFIFSERQL
jgi:DNA-binding NarL/FixJ family response regulator